MKLPSLSELEFDNEEPIEKKKTTRQPKRSTQSTKNKATQSSKKINLQKEDEVEEVENKRPKVPKSQYDDDGNPILTIPDLDDVDLTSEIDRFFGKGR